jgi:hypothetical protein
MHWRQLIDLHMVGRSICVLAMSNDIYDISLLRISPYPCTVNVSQTSLDRCGRSGVLDWHLMFDIGSGYRASVLDWYLVTTGNIRVRTVPVTNFLVHGHNVLSWIFGY